jgi:hypothetical protein
MLNVLKRAASIFALFNSRRRSGFLEQVVELLVDCRAQSPDNAITNCGDLLARQFLQYCAHEA